MPGAAHDSSHRRCNNGTVPPQTLSPSLVFLGAEDVFEIDTPKKREIREKMFSEKYEAKQKAYLSDIRKAAMIECR